MLGKLLFLYLRENFLASLIGGFFATGASLALIPLAAGLPVMLVVLLANFWGCIVAVVVYQIFLIKRAVKEGEQIAKAAAGFQGN